MAGNVQASDLDWPILLQAGEKCSGLGQELILSVIWVESRGNPNAVNVNGVGGFSPSSSEEALRIIYKHNRANTDIGLMQINWKTWGPFFGLKAVDLLDPITNVCVGSRILRDYIDEHKGSWRGVGRYNAVSYDKQRNYASVVGATYKKILAIYKRQNAANPAQAQVKHQDQRKRAGNGYRLKKVLPERSINIYVNPVE
jgi:soluble lytic murein transglycosylase-like protein